MEKLPLELQGKITEYLPLQDFARSRQINKRFKNIAKKYYFALSDDINDDINDDYQETGIIYGNPQNINNHDFKYMRTLFFKKNENKYVKSNRRNRDFEITTDDEYSFISYELNIPEFYNTTSHDNIFRFPDINQYKHNFWKSIDHIETDDYIIETYMLDINNYILSGNLSSEEFFDRTFLKPSVNISQEEIYGIYKKKYILDHLRLYDFCINAHENFFYIIYFFNPLDVKFKNGETQKIKYTQLKYHISDNISEFEVIKSDPIYDFEGFQMVDILRTMSQKQLVAIVF